MSLQENKMIHKLVRKYPKLFKTCKIIECDKGWDSILENLCNCIQDYITRNTLAKDFDVTQVKEKFGTLRFYTNYSDDYIDGMVYLACYLSSKTCEFCGTQKSVSVCRFGGWIKTACKECRKTK